MHPDLPRVRELQQVDDRIRELREEINRLPKHIAKIEQQLDAHQKQLKGTQNELVENKKSHRLLESEVVSLEQKISRLREQMNEAKTNEQFRAFQHEIEFVESQIRQAEDHILDKMAEAETLEQNVATAEEALGVEAKKVEQDVAEAKGRVAQDEQEMRAAEEKRTSLAKALAPEVLRTYERIRRTRDGQAVAPAAADRCLACNVVFRPQFSQTLRENTQVMTCESCGRILYYEPLGEESAEKPAGHTRAVRT